MANEREIKAIACEFKDLNDSKGEVTFKFSDPAKDDNGDIVDTNTAYKKSIDENKGSIYHNRDHEDKVGKPQAFFTDSTGAYCTSKLAMKTVAGNDTYEQYKAGLVTGHSIEFVAIKHSYSNEQKARILKEVKLYGVTTMVNKEPANANTPLLNIKSLEDLALQQQKINNLLTKGNISDECAIQFLTEYKKLESIIAENKSLQTIASCKACGSNTVNYKHMDTGQGKCDNCGRFTTKIGNTSFFKNLPIDNFSLKM